MIRNWERCQRLCKTELVIPPECKNLYFHLGYRTHGVSAAAAGAAAGHRKKAREENDGEHIPAGRHAAVKRATTFVVQQDNNNPHRTWLARPRPFM